MKRFKHILSKIFSPDTLLWFLPLTLTVPNVLLDITERASWLVKLTNVVLPFGIYLLLAGLSRRIGRTALLCLPFMIYAAFQIVLLNLYGESIIAIDMLLNVVTTSMGEATELLGNLALAIATVCILYIPVLAWGITLTSRSIKASDFAILRVRHVGAITAVTGLLLLSISFLIVPRFSIVRHIFPINVISNTVTAANRYQATLHYHDTSADFNFNASSTRNNSQKEIYVLVIGETSRADNWQLLGYNRPTNPRLSKRDSLIVFTKVLSESNTTHKSVPLMLAPVSTANFGDSIYSTKSLISAFNQAGFQTAFLSNQGHNRSFIDFFAQEAQISEFLCDKNGTHLDNELLPLMDEFINNSQTSKLLIVLHTYGSHFNYNDRYKAAEAVFTPDRNSAANKANRDQLINAYDNTIINIDQMLDNVIDRLKSENCPAAMLYLSDHGEDIFDDKRGRFLHASPSPTYYQLHVPMILWLSQSYIDLHPDSYKAAIAHQNIDIAANQCVFHSMMALAGIETPYFDPIYSIINAEFTPSTRYYLNDYNEQVPLLESGLRDSDLDKLSEIGISSK